MRSAVTPQQISSEETKVRQVEESIRVFVRVADPKFRQVVPMRFFNLTLTPAEADACSADYLDGWLLRWKPNISGHGSSHSMPPWGGSPALAER
jgi:hypothetical protein